MIVRSNSRWVRIIPAAMAVLILGPAAYGFVEKLILFIQAVRRDLIAGFAIVPVVIYLVVTTGMACLLVWAIQQGMFRDVERPKYEMLEREAELDRRAGQPWSDAP
jgi:nitrogen fixation-related uncharacterized protein